jgi:hypothetical protein
MPFRAVPGKVIVAIPGKFMLSIDQAAPVTLVAVTPLILT